MPTFGPDINRVPQRLYDSEINFAVSSFWDGGFSVKIGDDMNGFRASADVATWTEVLFWLDRQAREHFPGSTYAKS